MRGEEPGEGERRGATRIHNKRIVTGVGASAGALDERAAFLGALNRRYVPAGHLKGGRKVGPCQLGRVPGDVNRQTSLAAMQES